VPDLPPPDDGGDHELQALRAIAGRIGVGATDPVQPLDIPPDGLWERIAAEVETQVDTEVEAAGASVATFTPRRRSWFVTAVAAAAALVVVAAAAAVLSDGDDAEVLATASLERLGPAGTGSAELLDDGGDLQLRIDTTGLAAGDGFLEVWVIDTEVQRLVSLGPLRPDGLYDLPDGLDPEAFPIVDVSVEPIDGDPTHSGDSVLRGQLEF
jgi:anti-sigma-K factor RskA